MEKEESWLRKTNSWACMHLLWDHIGRDKGPQIEEWMQGRHSALIKLWRKWGEQQGYLPATPDDSPASNLLTTLLRALGWK